MKDLDTFELPEPDRYLLSNGHPERDKEELRQLIFTRILLRAQVQEIADEIEREWIDSKAESS